ncbi:hypothetical protein IJ182_03930 [bacterium]|nr:hypothetical protein [bacterium]
MESDTIPNAEAKVQSAQTSLSTANSLLSAAQSMPATITETKNGITETKTNTKRVEAILAAQAAINAAKAELEQAKAELEQARADQENEKAQLEAQIGDVENSIAELEAQIAQLETEQQEAEANLAEAQAAQEEEEIQETEDVKDAETDTVGEDEDMQEMQETEDAEETIDNSDADEDEQQNDFAGKTDEEIIGEFNANVSDFDPSVEKLVSRDSAGNVTGIEVVMTDGNGRVEGKILYDNSFQAQGFEDYQYNEDNTVAKSTVSNIQGELISYTNYSYNDGKISGSETYDSDNNRIGEEKYNYNTSNGELQQHIAFDYNTDGKTTGMREYDNAGNIMYDNTYENNFLMSSVSRSQTGEITQASYSYDDGRKTSSSTTYDSSGNLISMQNKEYVGFGDKISAQENYDPNGILLSSEEYTYDSSSSMNCIKTVTTYDKEGQPESVKYFRKEGSVEIEIEIEPPSTEEEDTDEQVGENSEAATSETETAMSETEGIEENIETIASVTETVTSETEGQEENSEAVISETEVTETDKNEAEKEPEPVPMTTKDYALMNARNQAMYSVTGIPVLGASDNVAHPDTVERNEKGLISSETYNDGDETFVVEYNYDKDGHVTSAVLSSYEAGEQNESRTLAFGSTGVIETEDIDEYGADGKPVMRHSLEYTANGEPAFLTHYQYDSKGKPREIYMDDLDERIGYSRQGNTYGDCWLLSGISSLSYTDAGQKIIKDAISSNPDGSYNIELKGIDSSVNVTQDELEYAYNSGKYSKGDRDVLLMELAFEKAIKGIKNGDYSVIRNPRDLTVTDTKDKNIRNYVLDNRNFEDVMFLLTGHNVATAVNTPTFAYKSCIDSDMDLLEQHPGKAAVTISFSGSKELKGTEIKDIYGNVVYKLSAAGGHGFSVKSVDGDYVTIVNPYDSSKEYVVTRETLYKYSYAIQCYHFKDDELKA